ncbi:MAG: DUF2971 domain-containing protein [Ignavibacteriaceae bacterium]
MNDVEYMMSKIARIEICELLKGKADIDQLKNLESFSIPKSLFKYSSLNEYTLKNLKENELTSTIPIEFNDIYDSTMHFDSYTEGLRHINQLNEACKKVGLEEVINKEYKDRLLKDSSKKDEHKLTYLTKDFRITSLSTNVKDIKMWSHYANNNKGICINYDFSKSISKITNLIYPVIYIDNPVDMTEICEDLSKVITAVLCSIISKFRDWEYEKEWRVIRYSREVNDKRIQLRNIPKPECIFIGNRFIENYRQAEKENRDELTFIEEFLDYVKKTRISLKIIKPQIRSFSLEFEDIDVDGIIKKNLC